MPRPRKPASPAERALDAVAALPLVHYVYRDFDEGGFVLPNKPYELELPPGAESAIAVLIATIKHPDADCADFRVREAMVRDGRLHLNFDGLGVAGGVSALFVLPG